MEAKYITKEKALNLLFQGIHLGQKKGAYTLNEAALLNQAINILEKPEAKPKTTEEKKVSVPLGCKISPVVEKALVESGLKDKVNPN